MPMSYDRDLARFRAWTAFLVAMNFGLAVWNLYGADWVAGIASLFWTGTSMAIRHTATLNQRTRNRDADIQRDLDS